MKDIDSKLNTIVNLVKDKEKPVTKSEMEELLSATSKKKEASTYRQVSEKPVVVDVMDISDAAAKKLAAMMSGNQQTQPSPVETVDGKSESTSIIGKLLGFAKDIFLKVLAALGKVVGWVIGTLTSLLKQLSSWVLKKIQTAMAMAVTRSMGGMGGRFRRAGLVSAAFKLTAGALAAKGAYDMFQGFDKVESQLDNINTQAQSIFSDPESMISSGMASAPDFTAFGSEGGSSVTGDDGIDDAGSGPVDEDVEEEDDQPADDDIDDTEPDSPLGDINVQATFPMDELDQEMGDALEEEKFTTSQDSDPPLTTSAEQAGVDLQESVGMFKDAEELTPSDQDGKKIAKLLNEGVNEISKDINVKMMSGGSPAGGSPSGGSSGGSASSSPIAGGSKSMPSTSKGTPPPPSINTQQTLKTGDSIFPPFDAAAEAALDQRMIDSGIFAPTESMAGTSPESMIPQINKANVNIENLVEQATKSNDNMSSLQSKSSTTGSGPGKMSPSKKSFSGSVTPSVSKPPGAASGPPGAGPASISPPPIAPTSGASQSIKSSRDQLSEKMETLSQALQNKQVNIVQKNETKSETVVDFVSSTDTHRSRMRNN